MGKYGAPYMGSKNFIAEWVIDQLPSSDTFVDLFAGGCAITHCALLSHKYNHFIANDLDGSGLQLFIDAIKGKYKNEKRWISREDFYKLKDEDPYVKWCFSFGNNGNAYMYSKEIEPFKKCLHELFFAKDSHDARLKWKEFTRLHCKLREEIATLTEYVIKQADECGIKVEYNRYGQLNCKAMNGILKIRKKEIQEYMHEALVDSGLKQSDIDKHFGFNGMAGHWFNMSQWALPTKEQYEELQAMLPKLTKPWGQLNYCSERLQSLQRLESLESSQRLQSYKLDYQEVQIPKGAVIYCDIPYKDKAGYNGFKFDYERFYSWAEKQENIFISEEYMPEDRFKCIAEKKKIRCLCATDNSSYAVEKLYVPINNDYEKKGQIKLFD